MGTYGIPFDKGDSIRDALTRELEHDNERSSSKVLRMYIKDFSVAYCVMRWQSKRSITDIRTYPLICSLERFDGYLYYKPMEEDCGPYYYDMPLQYLELCDPPESERAKEWRSEVEVQAKLRKAKRSRIKHLRKTIRNGDTISAEGHQLYYWYPRARKYVCAVRWPNGGQIYRITADRLEQMLREKDTSERIKQRG